MKNLSDTEKSVLNRIQKDWLICESPFKELAEELNINENDLIHIIDSLKQRKIIRDISAIFNADRLGYESALIAFELPTQAIETAALIINEHNGVSHNYLRDHRYNIWFTLVVDRKNSLENEIKQLAGNVKPNDYLIFKNEKLYKIGVMFNIDESKDTEEFSNYEIKNISPRELSLEEKKAVYVLQNDLLPAKRPFRHLIKKLNMDIDEKKLVQTGEVLKQEGVIRRYSAILKHTEAGYTYNAMTAWKFIDHNDDKIIKKFIDVPNISHLYMRTIYPGKWEHGLFAMIHAKSEDELKRIIKKLENESGIKDYLVLRSMKEFKKKRVKYFMEEFN
ncbi:MAG: Lrp/AsnC family transcriptional regulator [Spirochaetes bacterium]|nr:Lrp/AsnC family transcriptional regulator [Spirochaetota bacterium]